MQNIDIRLYIRYSNFKENIFIIMTNKKLQKYIINKKLDLQK